LQPTFGHTLDGVRERLKALVVSMRFLDEFLITHRRASFIGANITFLSHLLAPLLTPNFGFILSKTCFSIDAQVLAPF
jgi:hypothetical protein